MRQAYLRFAVAFLLSGSAFAQSPIALNVDLTDAPRKLLHATEAIPVQPGPLTLVYPKWIPGEHGPTGPIDNMAGFIITANGQRIAWQRDPVDMFAFHLVVPEGASQLNIKLDFLATATAQGVTAGASTSPSLAVLSWNTILVYPADKPAAEVMFSPSITLPSGWQYGTALQSIGAQATTFSFSPVPLETLIDSPVLTGRYFREIPLAPEVSPKHYLDLAGDGPEDIALSDEHIAQYAKLVREAGALFKSRHYGSYHFLVTLSDQAAHLGLEHHQSSDDRVAEKTFTDDGAFLLSGDLLPHEFTHSWNGKYRRPAGLATPNYQDPMKSDLLWVYEGLTQYFGYVLTARSGLWTPAQFREDLASIAASFDAQPGRTWRSLQDTATMAQVLYNAEGGYENWRRSTDFYDEGMLVWLDVDTTIREKTKGHKSLNDFAAAFHGLGGNTAPKVVPYTFEDVIAALNTIAPNDWTAFFRERLDSNQPSAPLGGLQHGGYRLAYTDAPTTWALLSEAQNGSSSFWYSLGLRIGHEGEIEDVLVHSLADQNGFGPGMKVIAVNGRAYASSLLRTAIHDAAGKGKPPIELIVQNVDTFRVLKLDYHGGERYPQLQRISGAPDYLDQIVRPMTK